MPEKIPCNQLHQNEQLHLFKLIRNNQEPIKSIFLKCKKSNNATLLFGMLPKSLLMMSVMWERVVMIFLFTLRSPVAFSNFWSSIFPLIESNAPSSSYLT